MKRSKELATYHREVVSLFNGKFVRTIHPETVRVMVRAEGYVMVRRKGAAPFVVSERELTKETP